jgi:hypothetical protein
LAYRLKAKSKEEILEEMRRGLVATMRLGGNFVINIDKVDNVDWSEWHDDSFFPKMLWNYDEWRED